MLLLPFCCYVVGVIQVNDMSYLQLLCSKNSFNRLELQEAMKACGYELGEASFKKKLQELLTQRQIVRVGRNAYRIADKNIAYYHFDYSTQVKDLSDLLNNSFPYLEYSIFELRQLNEFLNHQVAHNTVFLSVERDVISFVFETLKEHYHGRVLISPSKELFDQYWCDNMIVLNKRITETPKGIEESWHSRIEKVLVDLIADPLIQDSIGENEFITIFEDAFYRYVVDESCLFRYARRRGVDKELQNLIVNSTTVQLRTVG